MGPQRWPEVLTYLEGQRESFREFGDLKSQLKASLAWYKEQFPSLTTDRRIEMENISAIAAATVFFCLDLRILSQCDSPNTVEALSASDQNGVWEDIDSVVDHYLPNFASYIKAYLRWVFVKKEDQVWEIGSRPPVGRYGPGAARRMGRSGGGFDSRGPSGNRRPSQGRSGGPQGGRRDQGGLGERGDRGGRDGGDRPGQRQRPQAPGKLHHAEQERLALEAVRVAVDRLRTEPSLSEVRLDPSNSFFRRLQHKKAVSEGFYSFSTGEGMERAVVVTRDKPEHEDVP